MASMPDLARWGQALLRLDPDDVRWRPHSRIRDGLHYGLGWRLDKVRGRRRVWHSGQCSGYAALLQLDPDGGKGYALAANRSGSLGALQAAAEALDRGMPGAGVAPLPRERPVPAAPPLAAAAALPAGDFRHPGYGGLRVLRQDGRLFLQFQNSFPSPVWVEDGALRYTLPIYDVTFPVAYRDGAVEIPFETKLPPIRFTPADGGGFRH